MNEFGKLWLHQVCVCLDEPQASSQICIPRAVLLILLQIVHGIHEQAWSDQTVTMVCGLNLIQLESLGESYTSCFQTNYTSIVTKSARLDNLQASVHNKC